VSIAAADNLYNREIKGYAVAVVATAAVIAIRYSLLGLIGNEAPLLLFIVPITFAAWCGGLRPGLFATALAMTSGVYFFIEHTGLWVHHPLDMIRVTLLLCVGSGISCASHAFHRQLAARKRSEEQLRESEARYRVLTEISPQTIWVSRPDGCPEYCNQHWFNYTGLTMEETQGQGWTLVIHPEERQRVVNVWRAAREAGVDYEVEIPFRRASDGTYRWHLVRGLPIKDESRRIVRWIGIAVDIHDHRHVQQLEEYRRQLEEANARLELLAATDGLTRLKNRRAFQEKLSQEIERAARDATSLSLLLLDVDRFKQFNDDFGHPAGDSVLRGVALLLEETARSTDFVARYGGEEFAILLPNTDEEGAVVLAERFRVAVMEAEWKKGAITVSVGAATLAPGEDGAALIDEADAALYGSKRSGRNCVRHAAQLRRDGCPPQCEEFVAFSSC
jgi:diguanylate cyclase (GGDEF)-like protein/PAS domain S-box-containing protein